MKFLLLELVTCGGSASRLPDPPQAEETLSPVLPSPPLRPTRTVSRRYRNRKRARSGSSVDWRPSLCEISEDNVVPERDRRTFNAGSGRTLKRKVASAATTTAGHHVRNYSSDGFGRSGFPTIIPAFSAAPFLF